MTSGILITDGDDRSALAAARALVAAGYTVYVTAPRRLCLAGVTRHVHPVAVSIDALTDASGYVAELGRLVRDRDISVLLPMTDVSVEVVLEHRALLPADLAIPFPDVDTYRRASDKLQILDVARAAGFAVPPTLVLRSPRDAESSPDPSLFPAVVKPHRSVMFDAGERRTLGVEFVADEAGYREALAALPATAYPVLLQRRVVGSGEGLFALRWKGRTRALFAHRRLREKPPAGGVSVYRESIALPPGLVDAAERLLDALDWEGVAMIECKRDPTTGRHVIMEVNGRFWGSLQLAIDAGVNFPALLVACALGQDSPPARAEYRVGIRSRWFWGDVDHLYLRLTRTAAALDLLAPVSSRLGAVLQFLAFRPGRDRNEIWRWSDPAPFVLETLQRFGLVR